MSRLCLTITKEEHFAIHHEPYGNKGYTFKFGMKKDGLASAIEMSQIADAGVCASTQEFMLAVGTNTLPILCKTDNKKYEWRGSSNQPHVRRTFRGYWDTWSLLL